MTEYIVHLYREMRLTYTGIEAETPETAAALVHAKPTDDADNIEDCDGEDLSAQVDVAGDEDYSQSVTIDFEPERQHKAAAKLLAALEAAEGFVHWALEHGSDEAATSAALQFMRTAIAGAKAAEILPSPSTAAPPARFDIEHNPQENPDRAYVLVDGKFDVAIIRTSEAIIVNVYPKDWMDPIDTLTDWDEQVAELESDAAEEK